MPAIATVLAEVAAAACRDVTVAQAAGVPHAVWSALRTAGGRVFDGDDPWMATMANAGRTPYLAVKCETVAIDQRTQEGGIATSRVEILAAAHRFRHAPAAARVANILDAAATAVRSLPENDYAMLGDDEYGITERRGVLLMRSLTLIVQHAAVRGTAAGSISVPPSEEESP